MVKVHRGRSQGRYKRRRCDTLIAEPLDSHKDYLDKTKKLSALAKLIDSV